MDQETIDKALLHVFIDDPDREALEYVQSHGQLFNSVKRPKDIRKRPPKTCFESCQQFVLEHEGYTYCEGFSQRHEMGFQFRHAWVVTTGSLDVIDLVWNQEWIADSTYFGVPFTDGDFTDMAEGTGIGCSYLDILIEWNTFTNEGEETHG